MNKIEEYKRIVTEFPLSLTLDKLELKMKEKLHLSTIKSMEKKDKKILHILRQECVPVLKTMKSKQILQGNKKENHVIWVMWLQGFDDAPKIVKICRKFLEKYKPNSCEIIELTADNLSHYVHFSNDIVEKIEDGTITYTHLSDLVRAKVLSQYGGIWVDSTVLVTDYLSDDIFSQDWTTIKGYPEQGLPFIKSRWTGFFMGGMQRDLYLYLDTLFDFYWKHHDVIIDYLMIDYLIELISESNSDIEKMMNLEPNNNQNVFELLPLLQNDSVFDEAKINSLLDGPTILYKLSYKLIDENSKGVQLLQGKIEDFNA